MPLRDRIAHAGQEESAVNVASFAAEIVRCCVCRIAERIAAARRLACLESDSVPEYFTSREGRCAFQESR